MHSLLVHFLALLSALAPFFSPALASHSFPSQSVADPEIRKTAVLETKATTTKARSKPVVTTKAKAAPISAAEKPIATAIEPKPEQEHVQPAAADVFASQTERLIFELSNKERQVQGLPALVWDERLHEVARHHSEDMIVRNYFAHEDPDGCSSSCRVDANGYLWSSIGENIFMTSGYELKADPEAEHVVSGWMQSPGHKANILGTQYSNTAVGIAVRGEDVFVTAMYLRPR